MKKTGRIGIEVDQISKSFKQVQAIQALTTRFSPGTLHGIIGPDGAGKTTLLRILMGLLRPDEGKVNFAEDGEPIPFFKVRPSIAYMPQQQTLYPDLTCSEHLDFFRDLYQLPAQTYRDRRKNLLHITRMEPFQDRLAGKLSGGMYKKLGLMCTLLHSPKVILLDEPTNGVDPISRRELWELLYQLLEEEILVIVTTSYMDEAERCGMVHLVDSGRLLVSGAPRAVQQKENVSSFEDLFLKKLSTFGARHRGAGAGVGRVAIG